MKFEDFKLSTDTLAKIRELKFTQPTQVQEESIPSIIQGKDVIGESATGSGKTLAFGAGIVEHSVPKQGVQALVLTPTRELAEQVKTMVKQLSSKLHIMAVYGGVGIEPQIKNLRVAEVVVATPGRLLDHLQRGTINLDKLKLLVLDEADHMLDMGFIEDVERIINHCPKERQTLFFSATMPSEVQRLAHRYMHEPVKVSATKMVDPSKLSQVYFDVQRNVKLSLLTHLLQKEDRGLVMVFCNTRNTVDFVAKTLKVNGIKSIAIHGGFTQNKRNKSLEMFNDGKFGVLVCTDVAARGLHINDVSHVYNYDIPKNPKEYVHRIGRTARAGKEGQVINLLCDYDHDNFSRVKNDYREFEINKVQTPPLSKIKIARVVASNQFRGRPRNRGRFSN